MASGTIFKIKRYALHDGPGIRTTVFFKGCPLACRWCHNPEGMDGRSGQMTGPQQTGDRATPVGEVITVEELVTILEKDQLFYDESGGGVTFSGGEPLAQPDFLEALLTACGHREIHVALDTSGHAPTEVVAGLLDRIQLVLFDLKVMDEARHRQLTGQSNRLIFENLRCIAARQTPLRLRIPLIPGLTDGEENLEGVAAVAATIGSLEGIDLLPFHRIAAAKYQRLGLTDPMAGTDPPPPGKIAAIRAWFESAGHEVTIGGET